MATEWRENSQRSGAWGGGGGGWPLLAVMERECITGSCVLYERDGEKLTKKEITSMRDSQNEKKPVNHLKAL